MALEFILKSERIPIRIRKKLAKLVEAPAPGIAFSTSVFGAQYQGTTGNFIDNKVYVFGSYEPSTIRLIRAVLTRQANQGLKTCYIDVGTNVGQHLVAVAALAQKVVGFEPWQMVREKATTNIALNQFTHAEIFPYALGEVDTELPFYPPVGGNLGVGSFVKERAAGTMIYLRVVVGDKFLQERGLTPSLIKIDTEGFEAPVLRGLRQVLEQTRPVVIFEKDNNAHGGLHTLEEIYGVFPAGYSFHGIKRSQIRPALKPLASCKRVENVLAWPDADDPRLVLAPFIE